MAKVKLWKVKLSGTYFTNGKDHEEKDYEVEGTIPYCDKDWVLSFVKARYLAYWIKEKYKKTPALLHRYEIEKLEEVEGECSIDLMKINDMDWDQLQELSTTFTLTSIPRKRQGSLKESREIAKRAYLEEIMDIDLTTQKDVLVGMQNGRAIVDLTSKEIQVRLSDMVKAPTKEERSLESTLKAMREEEDQKVKLDGRESGAKATVIK